MSSFANKRVSRLASSCPKDFDFESFVYSSEAQYKIWCSVKRILLDLRQIENNSLWNILISVLILVCLILVAADYSNVYLIILDIAFNVIYGVHVVFTTLERARQAQHGDFHFTRSTKWALLFDVLTYLHYVGFVLSHDTHRIDKLVCYFVRLHTSFDFLWAMTDKNMKGSVIGTALKYCFIFLVFRVFYSIIWMHIPIFQHRWVETNSETDDTNTNVTRVKLVLEFDVTDDSTTSKFIRSAYLVNMMFLPVGPMVHPKNDYERIALLVVVITGSFVVTGAAVASLALVMSLYMRPEEEFRGRFRLIMDEMKTTHVPQELRDKVETFYRMYWHKEKAISETALLPIFPHTIPCTIYTDIYFEAQQKSPILCDLSYQFLWEVAKVMETTHYVPGDTIINRDSVKSSIIYIAYGDVEMLTAEDDVTPILRFTRGSIISPCAGSPALGCARALVKIQAATFCTAHVLTAANLWRVACKYGKANGQAFIILSSFEEHFEKVKRHYKGRVIMPVKYKSSILQFKRNLIALKEAKDEYGTYLLERTDFFLEISDCYIMRNRADSRLTEEADEICLRPKFPCILQPHSSLLVAWNSLVSVLILVVSFTHPYFLIYFKNVSLEFTFFDYMVTALFLLDLVIHLSTGANVEEGVPITFTQTSTQQIRSSWFWLDALGTIPLFEFVGDGKFAGLNKLLRLPRLFRMLKSMEDVCVYQSNLLRFLSYSMLMFILCYLIAGMQQGYMCFLHDHCRVKNLTHAPYWKREPLTDTVTNRMFFGLYWAVGIITFTSHNTNKWNTFDWRNLMYNTLLLESVAILYTFMESMYSATIMVTTSLKEDYDQTIGNVKDFLIRNCVDPVLRQRFIRYLQLCWYTDKAYSMTQKKESIFYDLPPHVYQDIVAKQRIKYLLCIPFMKFVKREDFKAISAASKLFYTSPNEILLSTGDINNEIFIIKQGICEVYDPETEQAVETLRPKQYFGVLECLLRFPAHYTVRAVTHVQIFTISRKYLGSVLSVPRVKDAIEYVKRQPDYLNVQLRHEPFLSYEDPPPTRNLSRFPLLRKFEPDTAFLQPFMNLGYFSILRYIFPRFTIRPDGTYIYRYEWFRALCALTASLMYPSYSYMVLQFPWLYTFLSFLDFCAYFDIFQRMMVGYFNAYGILVYHPASTAANYIKGPFIVDLLAASPMENLESTRTAETASSETAHETVSFVKQLLMMNRLLQLYRLPGAMDILSQYITREDVIIVIKSIPLFMILLNVLTCFIVFSSVNIYIRSPDSSRVNLERWKIVPYDDVGGSWINLFSNTYRFNMTESPWNLQLTIYSWVVYEITTTGFNNFKPSNNNLLHVLFFGMCAGCMMKTYFSVRIISIRANVNKMLANFQESIKDIKLYMTKENLSPNMQAKLLDYYEYNWNKTGGLDYSNVLKLCDQITLRTDAILHLYGHTFYKCPILYHCDVSLLRVVGRSVRGVHFLAGTRIIHRNDVITDMYIVDYGTLDVKETKESHLALANLVRGSVFGNMEKQGAVRCPTEITTTSNVHLLQINAMVFHTIIVDFPTVKVFMRKYRPNNENYILGRTGDSSATFTDWKQSRPSSATKMNVNLTGITNKLNINNTPAQYYLILVSLLCVYGDIYNAGFQFNHVAMISCLYILDICFYIKIIFHYILPYVVNEGEARDELINARKKYMHGEFKYDILSCLPIECFAFLFTKSEDKWRWLSVLRLNRLLRIVTINGCLTRHFAKLSINLTISTVIMTLIWFSLFVHGMACIWYAIGVSEDNSKKKSSWMYKDDGSEVCDNAYICSIYFILTTFIEKGVGDVLPKKQLEVVFTIILELISTMMFMIYVGEFSNIFQYQSFRSFTYYRKHLELLDFLSNNRVSKNLISLVKKYSLHLWRESRGVQMPYFLEKAPPCFKLKIMGAAYTKHFINHPAFRECEPAFLRQLVGCVQLYTYSPDIYVAKEGEITDSMYLVHKGKVLEFDEDMEEILEEFHAGQSFGMIHGLTRNLPFNYSYKTVKKSEVLTLNLDSWEHLLCLFPKSRYEIFKNVPDHPYGKPPDDKYLIRSESLWRTTSVISQPIHRESSFSPFSERIESSPKEQLTPPRGIAPMAATGDTGSDAREVPAGIAAGAAGAAGLATVGGLATAVGVADRGNLPSENVEKKVAATKDEALILSSTSMTSPADKERRKIEQSKQEITSSHMPLSAKGEPPKELSSIGLTDSRHRSQDVSTKSIVKGKEQEVIRRSSSADHTESKTSWGTLKTIAAPRPPVEYPSHANFDISEIASTSSKNKSKGINTIESNYFDENDQVNVASQNNLFRRMTITAKKLIGKDKKEKNDFQAEQDLKITSELLDKYKHKVGEQSEKSLLDQYIEKIEAKKAAEAQNDDADQNYEEPLASKASRRSVVAFGDRKNKAEKLVLPTHITENAEEEINAIPLAPRRSVVVIGNKIIPENRKIKDAEKEISQTASTQILNTGTDNEKQSKQKATPDRPKLPIHISQDDKQIEDDFSKFPYPVRHKDSDYGITLKKSESNVTKDKVKEKNKLETRSGKSIIGILEPQSEVETVKSIDLLNLSEQERKTAEFTQISNTEKPQTSKSLAKQDKKSQILDNLINDDDASPSTLEDFLDQTHKSKSKSKPTSHDKVTSKHKIDIEKRMEKRTKVRYEGDGNESGLPTISRSTGGMETEPLADDDLRRLDTQLPSPDLQQLMDSDEVSTRSTEKSVKPPKK